MPLAYLKMFCVPLSWWGWLFDLGLAPTWILILVFFSLQGSFFPSFLHVRHQRPEGIPVLVFPSRGVLELHAWVLILRGGTALQADCSCGWPGISFVWLLETVLPKLFWNTCFGDLNYLCRQNTYAKFFPSGSPPPIVREETNIINFKKSNPRLHQE